jgi:putative N-acetyltransferase (TIGR04045 family)
MQRFECRRAAGPAEEAAHHRIRHEVFVVEQAVFAGADLDARDAEPSTIKVVGFCDGVAAGAVRLYPLGDAGEGRWQGDRLAVLPEFRAHALGRPLVRFAVVTAARLGGREMVAHVQVANVRFFERLGWSCRGDVERYVGLPHQLMAIDLRSAAELVNAGAGAAGRSPARP